MTGQASRRPDDTYDFDRPLPMSEVDSVRVVGPYAPADVAAILTLVRAQTSEPVLDISTPYSYLQWYYRHEIELDALPTDTAEVSTGYPCDGRCGYGTTYYVVKRAGEWVVESSGSWMG